MAYRTPTYYLSTNNLPWSVRITIGALGIILALLVSCGLPKCENNETNTSGVSTPQSPPAPFTISVESPPPASPKYSIEIAIDGYHWPYPQAEQKEGTIFVFTDLTTSNKFLIVHRHARTYNSSDSNASVCPYPTPSPSPLQINSK